MGRRIAALLVARGVTRCDVRRVRERMGAVRAEGQAQACMLYSPRETNSCNFREQAGLM